MAATHVRGVCRVHGTYIQEKACSLVWHYADCDQDWGAMQARELTDHLEDILETDEVDIIPGQCRVEVLCRPPFGRHLTHIYICAPSYLTCLEPARQWLT